MSFKPYYIASDERFPSSTKAVEEGCSGVGMVVGKGGIKRVHGVLISTVGELEDVLYLFLDKDEAKNYYTRRLIERAADELEDYFDITLYTINKEGEIIKLKT